MLSSLLSSPIEGFRSALRAFIRSSGRNPSRKDMERIQEMREALQSKVKEFQQRGIRFIPLDEAAVAVPSCALGMASDSGESDEEGFFLDDESVWEDEEDVEVQIEQVGLGLPSSFGVEDRARMELGHLSKIETELREGQANDSLEALRAGLAEKSLRFRTEVKPAKSQKTMTRAWDSIHRADAQIKAAVQSYLLARNALVRLGAEEDLLSRYQEIQKKDLKMSRDVVEENRVGQRSSELAWFWRLGQRRHGQKDRGEFLKECKACPLHHHTQFSD